MKTVTVISDTDFDPSRTEVTLSNTGLDWLRYLGSLSYQNAYTTPSQYTSFFNDVVNSYQSNGQQSAGLPIAHLLYNCNIHPESDISEISYNCNRKLTDNNWWRIDFQETEPEPGAQPGDLYWDVGFSAYHPKLRQSEVLFVDLHFSAPQNFSVSVRGIDLEEKNIIRFFTPNGVENVCRVYFEYPEGPGGVRDFHINFIGQHENLTLQQITLRGIREAGTY